MSSNTVVSTLQNSPLNLVALREDGCRQLFEILDGLSGKTCMVMDASITGPLKHIVTEGGKALKEHGVGLFVPALNAKPIETSCESVLFIVRPNLAAMASVAAQIKNFATAEREKHISLYFVPRRTFICEHVLKEEGVYADIDTIGEYHVDLIPFDDDVLTMELEASFRECYLDGDSTSLYYVVRALLQLQALYGAIPNVKAKGTLSKIVLDMMLRVRREEEGETATQTPEIDTLILIDREVDLITPMVTPLTYEGLIDEIIGIENAFVKMDKADFKDKDAKEEKGDEDDDGDKGAGGGKSSKKRQEVTLALNSNDRLYSEIRDMNISSVTGVLQSRSRVVQAQIAGRHDITEIAEIKNFVKKIPGMQAEVKSLEQFIKVTEVLQRTTNDDRFHEQWEIERAMLEGIRSEDVQEYIERTICTREPVLKVLRLLCLRSVTEGGLKQKEFDHFRREVVQTYGYDWLFTLDNMERLGMFRAKKSTNFWPAIRRDLRLIDDDVSVDNPSDIHYVTSGYAPLSVRLVQAAMTGAGGWREINSAMKSLPGPTAEVSLDVGPKAAAAAAGAGAGSDATRGAGAGSAGSGGGAESAAQSHARKTVLVFFVGGVTFTEIAALRHMSEKLPFDFIVASTKVCNGTDLISSVVEHIENHLADDRYRAAGGGDSDDDDGGGGGGKKGKGGSGGGKSKRRDKRR